MSRLALLSLVLVSGCAIAEMSKLHDSIQASNAQAAANIKAAQAMAHTGKYVAHDRAWVCPTEQGALSGAACDGGLEYVKNRDLMVVGQAPANGVWPVATYDKTGEHRMYIAADAVNELPDVAALQAYAEDVDRRYPESRRIPASAVNFVDLLTHPKSYAGHYLVFRPSANTMSNMDFADGTFSFTIPVPVRSGSEWDALAQFEIHHRTLTEEFHAGHRGYSCGTTYCDVFVIVAELTDRTVQRIDEHGYTHTLPVFTIKELGDRFGSYRPE